MIGKDIIVYILQNELVYTEVDFTNIMWFALFSQEFTKLNRIAIDKGRSIESLKKIVDKNNIPCLKIADDIFIFNSHKADFEKLL